MFCPNCGTENEDSSKTCKKCGFNLKGAAAPKFKGTMLMMNAPQGVPRPGAAGPAAGGPKPGDKGVPSKLKGTMLGVAPPSIGTPQPPAGGPVAPPPAPAAPPMAGPGAPPGQPGQGPAGFGGAHGDVNPLGGTMVADPAGMAAGPGAPPGQYGGPPPGNQFGAPPAGAPQAGPYGAPPTPRPAAGVWAQAAGLHRAAMSLHPAQHHRDPDTWVHPINSAHPARHHHRERCHHPARQWAALRLALQPQHRRRATALVRGWDRGWVNRPWSPQAARP